MIRFWILVSVVLLTAQSTAGGEIIRCRTPDGTLVFADTATRVPADCEPVEKSTPQGTLTIIPDSPAEPAEKSRAEPEDPQASGLPDSGGVPASQATDQLFRLWQARVDELVADYRETLRQRYHATLLRDKRAAMDRLEQLKARKQTVLQDLKASPLSSSRQAAMRQALNEIPAP